jgi:hypothetical protein
MSERATRRDMARKNGPRALAAATMAAVLVFTFSGVALADVPNSGASHNCVATTSGLLYFREHGIHLGQDVRMFAPHGGQRDYVLGALQKTC